MKAPLFLEHATDARLVDKIRREGLKQPWPGGRGIGHVAPCDREEALDIAHSTLALRRLMAGEKGAPTTRFAVFCSDLLWNKVIIAPKGVTDRVPAVFVVDHVPPEKLRRVDIVERDVPELLPPGMPLPWELTTIELISLGFLPQMMTPRLLAEVEAYNANPGLRRRSR